MTTAPHLTVVPDQPPTFRAVGLGYVYEPLDGRLRFEATFLKRSSDFEVQARVEVTTTLPDAQHEYLIGARYNLSSDAARSKLANTLHERSKLARETVDFRHLVETFCVRVERAEARGGRLMRLGPQQREARRLDTVERLLPAGKIALLYGPPGVGKGLLEVALAICIKLGIPFCGLAVQPGEPLVIDLEDDEETFIERIQAVAAGMGLAEVPSILWFKPRGLLKHSVHELAEIVSQERVTTAFLDSVGHAAGAPGEHSSYEGLALDVFGACDAIGKAAPGGSLTWAWIDHVSAAGSQEKLAGKAIGAYRKMMDARVSWEIRKQQEQEQDSFTLALYHEKHNHTRKFAPIAIRLEFDNDEDGKPLAVRFQRTEVHEYDELASRDAGGLKGRVLRALGNGPARTAKALAEELDAETETVGMLLRRLRGEGKTRSFEPGGGRGKAALWGLSATSVNPISPIERKTDRVWDGDGNPPSPKPDTRNPIKPDQVSVIGSPAPPPGTAVRLPYAEQSADDDRDDLDDSPF